MGGCGRARAGGTVCRMLAGGAVPVARALADCAREARPGPSAMMVGGRGLEPIFSRGSCRDAIPRPGLGCAPPPCFFALLSRRLDVSRPTRSSFCVFNFPIPPHSACPRESGLVRG